MVPVTSGRSPAVVHCGDHWIWLGIDLIFVVASLQPTERDHKHCLYGHIEVCSAPCVGKVSEEQYRMQVENACEFLEGHCAEMVEILKADMSDAAAEQDYERAAKLRDQVEALRETTRKTTRYHRLPNQLPVAIDPDRDLNELAKVLEMPNPPAQLRGLIFPI